MKPSDHVIKLDQGWLREKRRIQEREDNIAILKFSISMLLIACASVAVILTIVSRTPL